MSENHLPIHIVLSSENLTQAQINEINSLTQEVGKSLSAQLNSADISYVHKDKLPQDAKVADLILVAGQIAIEIAPTVFNHITPWILGRIDEIVKGISARKGKSITAKVLVGNREEIITPKTTEAEIASATERIRIFNESPGDRFALVIGNSNYDDQSLPRLNAPAYDAQRFAEILMNPNIGAFSSVNVLIDKDKVEIETAIEDFFANKQHDDLLLFYYSGHGIKPPSDKQLLLTARNTTSKNRHTTSISDHFLRANMEDSQSYRQIVILDCCFGAAIVEGSKSDLAIGQNVNSISAFQSDGHGRIIITASDRTQYATDGKISNEKVENSLFTKYLIEGLEKGYADENNDGRVEIKELYNYVYKKIKRTQTPVMDARLEGEVSIGINTNRKVQPAELPNDITLTMTSEEYTHRLGAVILLEQLLRSNSHDKAVKEAVKNALGRLKDDYDTRVIRAADDMYNKLFGTGVPEPLPAPKSAMSPPSPVSSPSVPTPPQYSPQNYNPQTKKLVKNSNMKIIFILVSIFVAMCLCSVVLSNITSY